MNLNLRKARKLESRITNFAAPETVVTIRVNSENEDVLAELTSRRDAFTKWMADAERLLSLRYDIRAKIGRENSISGIDDLITKRQRLKDQYAMLAPFVEYVSVSTDEIVIDQLKNERESEGTMYSRKSASVNVNYFTNEMVEFVKETREGIKSQIEEIDEEILALNNKRTIELSESDVELLKEHKLL